MTVEIHNRLAAGVDVCDEIVGKASTQYNYGEMLLMTNGIPEKATATSKASHLFISMVTPASMLRPSTVNLTTTAGEKILAQRIDGDQVILKCKLSGNFAPPVNGVACNTNASTTSVKFDHASANGALANGVVYIPELGEQRLITADAKVSAEHTLTVTPAFRRAPTVGDTVIAVAFSKGMTAVKFDATTPALGISTAVGDISGGHAKIQDVDLSIPMAFFSLPDSE